MPLSLPPENELRWHHRVCLVTEILAAYARLLGRVRSNDLHAMVASARATPCARVETSPGGGHETAVRLGRIVQHVLGVLPTDNRCLIRSLVLLRVLERRGIPARIVVGVASTQGFGAHAWVEHESTAVLPRGAFEPLIEL